MKKLLICEKRSAAVDLVKSGYFGKFNNGTGFIENDKFIITWCSGHLYRRVKPQEINPDYGLKFKLDNNFNYKQPNLDKESFFVPYDKPLNSKDTFYKVASNQIKAIQNLLKRRDYDEIIFAADPDGEGERIHSDPIKYNRKLLPSNIKYTRFWNAGSYSNHAAVKSAYEKRLSITEPKYRNLLFSSNARETSDYLVGMIISKLLSDVTGTNYRSGRVNSSIIGIIGRREDVINNFKPQDYYNVKGLVKSSDIEVIFNHFFDDVDVDENGNEIKIKNTRYFNLDDANKVINDVKKANLTGKVIKSVKRRTSSNKPKLYFTDEFHVDFMDKYKVDMAVSNACLEMLYQKGFASYPRTDGNYLFKNELNDFEKNSIKTSSKYFSEKIKKIQQLDSNFKILKLEESNPIFNDSKAQKQNHTPLMILKCIDDNDLAYFASNPVHPERKIPVTLLKEAYEMIATRCLIQVMPDDIIEKESLLVDISGHKFEVESEKVIYAGWKQFDENAIIKKGGGLTISYNEGDTIVFNDVYSVSSQTTPPTRFTIKSLLKAIMFLNECIREEFNSIQDPSLKKSKMANYKNISKILHTANGLGTGATRETIIETMFKDKVLEEKTVKGKKTLFLTDFGRYKYETLPDSLKSIEVTALWEQKLIDIRNGAFSYDDFIKMVRTFLDKMVDEILSNSNLKNNMFSSSNNNSPTKKQLEVVSKIIKIFNLNLKKGDIDTFEKVSNIINLYKDKRYISDNKLALILSDKVNAPEKIKDIANKRIISLEENDVVDKFLSKFKENYETIQNSKVYSLKEKQLKILNDPRNNDKLSNECKELLKRKNEYSYPEYKILSESIGKIFESFSK